MGRGVFIDGDVPVADRLLAVEVSWWTGVDILRTGLLMLFFIVLIFLHAMAMSESTPNRMDNNIVYGFSPDRSRWNNYAVDFDDTIYFYDTKSIVKRNDNVKVWIKFGERISDNDVARIKEANVLNEINCSSRLIRVIEWNYISMKNEYNKYTSPTKWENIEPETANDTLLEEVCTQLKKVKKR